MVTKVVLNRVKSNEFPDTIEDVVFQRLPSGYYQFSPIYDKRYWEVEITESTIKAVNNVLKTYEYDFDALFFQAKYVNGWINKNKQLVTESEGHNYYK